MLTESDSTTAAPISECVEVFRAWMHLPDSSPLLAALGATAANLIHGDPVWLLLVAPPGGEKTEIVAALDALPFTHAVSTLTESGLLSGSPKKERDRESTGGLLRQVGDFGLLILKDFTSIISMNREARAQVLAALRECYDGSWTRPLGTDGGRSLTWTGKLGVVGGVTQAIDTAHAVTSAMGERFLLFRLPASDRGEQARRALGGMGQEGVMRTELRKAVSDLFSFTLPDLTSPPAPDPFTESEVERLVLVARLAVRCRSSVERDSHTREIVNVPESEVPTRLVKALGQLLNGLRLLGVDEDQAWSVVNKTALDCMPALRRKALDYLFTQPGSVHTDAVAMAVEHPTTTVDRALQDLNAHGVVARNKDAGKNEWSLKAWAMSAYEVATGIPAQRIHVTGGEA